MKKAKIMLMAITVLAAVGGALAFKAKTFSGPKFCYVTKAGHVAGDKCTTFVTNSTTTIVGIGTVYTTIAPTPVTTNADCTTITCPGTLSLKFIP